MLTEAQCELQRRSYAQLAEHEAAIRLPLSSRLAELLMLRARGPLSRIETAALRRELFTALDKATGTKGKK